MSEELNTTGKRQFGKKTQVGETIRWNNKKQSGWKYDGTHWVHYRNGKPTGKKERHRETARSIVKGLGIGTLARTFLKIPSEKEMAAYGPGTYNNNKRSNEETALLNKSKKNIKNKNNNKGALHNENNVKERKNTLDLKATDPKTGKQFKTNVHTKHYKTGERLGVLTRNQRRAYEAEAGDRTFEGEVAAFEKRTKHGKKHKRETLYKSHLRKKGEYPRR